MYKNNLLISIKTMLMMILLTGFIYPLLITTVAQTFFTNKSNGSIIYKENLPVGSDWLAQKFTSNQYFWPRPSAVEYNTLSSGGSNLSLTSQDLIDQVKNRKTILSQSHDTEREIPQDLLFASASGLDPQISPRSAYFQANRISKVRNIAIEEVRKLIDVLTEPRQFGILGEPRVNVLKLNLLLDEKFKSKK